jgi:hypothetical protein
MLRKWACRLGQTHKTECAKQSAHALASINNRASPSGLAEMARLLQMRGILLSQSAHDFSKQKEIMFHKLAFMAAETHAHTSEEL